MDLSRYCQTDQTISIYFSSKNRSYSYKCVTLFTYGLHTQIKPVKFESSSLQQRAVCPASQSPPNRRGAKSQVLCQLTVTLGQISTSLGCRCEHTVLCLTRSHSLVTKIRRQFEHRSVMSQTCMTHLTCSDKSQIELMNQSLRSGPSDGYSCSACSCCRTD